MSVIAVELSPEGIQRAIDKLEEWKIGKLEPFSQDMALYTAEAVYEDMIENVHVGSAAYQEKHKKEIGWDSHTPGRLRASISMVRAGDTNYVITANAVDNKGEPYAEIEQERGGDGSHDFASIVTKSGDGARKGELEGYISTFARMFGDSL